MESFHVLTRVLPALLGRSRGLRGEANRLLGQLPMMIMNIADRVKGGSSGVADSGNWPVRKYDLGQEP